MSSNFGITGSDLPGIPPSLPADINQRQIANTSLLGPTSFRMVMNRVPEVTYFCQSANIPSISVDAIDRSNMFVDVKEIGKPSFGDFTVTFLIDEEMKNWRAVYDWMKSIAAFEDFTEIEEQYADHKSDVILMVTTAGMNPNIEITLKGCFPTDLGAVAFDSTTTDIEPITADLTLAFDSYDVRVIP